MNYSKFKEEVREKIKDYLPESLRDSSVVMSKVKRTNGVEYDALILRSDRESASPVCYLNDLYKTYENHHDLHRILKDLANSYEKSFLMVREQIHIEEFTDFEKVKGSIFTEAINLEKNTELLKDLPYREEADLAVIYRVEVDEDKSFIINNGLASLYGINEETLYKAAADNVRRKDWYNISRLRDKFEEWGYILPEVSGGEEDIYIITDKKENYGAGCIAFPEVMESVMEKAGSEFYILPSSTHELLVVPSTLIDDAGILKAMVSEVNQDSESISEADKLSDNIYTYDPDTRSITICRERDELDLDLVQEEEMRR